MEFKSRNLNNVHFSVSNGELSGYRLIYVYTYFTERKERGEGGGRGKKGIYIYKIYRVDPFLSAGVVSMRQLALLYMLVNSLHVLIRHAHIFIQAYSLMRAHVHTHAHDAYEHKVHACIRTRHMHACTRTMLIHAYVHARANTRANAPTLV